MATGMAYTSTTVVHTRRGRALSILAISSPALITPTFSTLPAELILNILEIVFAEIADNAGSHCATPFEEAYDHSFAANIQHDSRGRESAKNLNNMATVAVMRIALVCKQLHPLAAAVAYKRVILSPQWFGFSDASRASAASRFFRTVATCPNLASLVQEVVLTDVAAAHLKQVSTLFSRLVSVHRACMSGHVAVTIPPGWKNTLQTLVLTSPPPSPLPTLLCTRLHVVGPGEYWVRPVPSLREALGEARHVSLSRTIGGNTDNDEDFLEDVCEMLHVPLAAREDLGFASSADTPRQVAPLIQILVVTLLAKPWYTTGPAEDSDIHMALGKVRDLPSVRGRLEVRIGQPALDN